MPETLSYQEQRRRQTILQEIAQRVAQDGPRVATHHSERARQFMPFAALRGHASQVRDAEQNLLRTGRHHLSEEEAASISAIVASLKRGDAVALRVYQAADGAYRDINGTVEEVVLPLQALRVGESWIPFKDIARLQRAK